MDTLDEILKSFATIQERDRPLWLLNTYRGIPVSHPAKVLDVSQTQVSVSIHEHQAISMLIEGKTYLQSDYLPEVIRADSVRVDVSNKQALLSEFVGVGDAVGKRAFTRVQPEAPIDAEIYDGQRRIGGQIADMSVGGLGIFTFAATIYGDLSFEKGKEVFVDFKLPAMEEVLRFQGVVTSILQGAETFQYRLGVQIFINPEAEPLLQEYIARRRVEILEELQEKYESVRQEEEGQS